MKYLPPETKLLVGGRGAENYGKTLEDIGALLLPGLTAFVQELESIRVH